MNKKLTDLDMKKTVKLQTTQKVKLKNLQFALKEAKLL